jgi:putative ubiquitin-RnfH superfamily antitoxin RatB of RatAB toxin-antitoxin module
MSLVLNTFEIQHQKTCKILVVTVLLLILISWFGSLDRYSAEYIDDSLVKSTVAFGVARSLNAVISVFQSVTVGVGMTVTIGEALSPLNNLIEDYASLMKLAIGSLIIQKLLVEIVSDNFFKALLSVSGALLLFGFYYKRGFYINVLARGFLFLVFVRFSLVLVIIFNAFVDHAFLEEKTEADVQALSVLSHDIDEINQSQKLSTENRATLEQQIASLEAENESINQLLREKNRLAVDVKTSLLNAQNDLDVAKKEIGFLNRLTNKDVSLLDDKVTEIKRELSETNKQIKNLEEQMEAVQQRKLFAQNSLSGKPNSIMESIGMTISDTVSSAKSLGEKFDALRMKEKLEGAIGGILNIMTLFLLKTLILPLLFLFALTKGIKLLWNIDLRDVLTAHPKSLVGA